MNTNPDKRDIIDQSRVALLFLKGVYKLVARKLSCPNCRFQSEKREPMWHGKKKAIPFIIHAMLRATIIFGSHEH